MPGVDHALRDVQCDVHSMLLSPCRERLDLPSDRFGTTGVQKQRWEPREVSVQRRSKRVLGVRTLQVLAGKRPQHLALNVVVRRVFLDARARHAMVDPGRDQQGSGGKRFMVVAESKHRCKTKAATRRVARQHETIVAHARCDQRAKRIDAIIERSRVGILRSKSVVYGDASSTAGERDAGE